MKAANLTPYINFDGNCEEAMNFYQSVLGGKLSLSRFGDSPMTKPGYEKKIIHAALENDDLSFFACDAMTDRTVGDNIHLSIAGADETKLRGFFEGLSAGGKVDMPLAKQFWGDYFGMLTDKYGIHWMVNIGSDGTSDSSSDQPTDDDEAVAQADEVAEPGDPDNVAL